MATFVAKIITNYSNSFPSYRQNGFVELLLVAQAVFSQIIRNFNSNLIGDGNDSLIVTELFNLYKKLTN